MENERETRETVQEAQHALKKHFREKTDKTVEEKKTGFKKISRN